MFELESMRPIVAIIGRPNVGKSRLFNRLAGKRLAIVEDQPGVTRDRNYAASDFQGRSLTIVDTGGLDPTIRGGIVAQVREQTEQAIREADLLLLLMDGKEGVNPVDREIIEILRHAPKKTFYVINKIDGPRQEGQMMDFYQLGIDPVHGVSAEHGYGVAELMEQVLKALPQPDRPDVPDPDLPKIAVVGRPNVGKSTLINTILGENRLVTSDVPGTTRDAIDTYMEYKDRPYLFMDTAGIRKRGRIARGIEQFSAGRTLKTLERCDIALLLLDASEGIVEQDTKIVGQILKLNKGCILLVNKWDLVKKGPQAAEQFRLQLKRFFPFLPYAPVLFLSALKGKKVFEVFNLIDWVMAAYNQRIKTSDLNRFFEAIMKRQPPPAYRGKLVKLYYFAQTGTRPPVFVTFCNYPPGVTSAYLRYLENQLRATFGFTGVPLKILVRKKR